MRRFVFILTLLLAAISVEGQILSTNDTMSRFDADSLRRAYDTGPYFTFYKDNYFVFGTALGFKPTAENSNVKFQISIQQKLTRTTLPFNTYLYLFYTQKCFWNVLQNSMPMTDLNFNPGIGIARPFFSSTTGRYVGKAFLLIEHESNGRDGDASRSWNKVSFGGNILIDNNIQVYAKFWIPIIDGSNNKDILKYCGIYQMGFQVMDNKRRFGASACLTKRADWNPFNWNTQLDIKYRLWERDNQYLFLQYYNGYGEGLLAYKEFHSEIRLGICLSPKFFSEY
ncbi:MAG: phospholipase A [Bacteroides sp.]|nr:phospholipase A [Bacteroides sp.]MCM1379146.1 phospholipase A [Bacteroides sp.]